jgi:hypothetical protein
MMTWEQFLISIVSLISTTALTYFMTDRLQQHLEYRKLKTKLDNFAGLQAIVIFENSKYKILSVDNHGIVMQNEMQTIFIPIRKALENVIALPSDRYDTLKDRGDKHTYEKTKSQFLQVMDELVDQIFPKLATRIKQEFMTDIMQEQTDVHFALRMLLARLLEAEGIASRQGTLNRPASYATPTLLPQYETVNAGHEA